MTTAYHKGTHGGDAHVAARDDVPEEREGCDERVVPPARGSFHVAGVGRVKPECRSRRPCEKKKKKICKTANVYINLYVHRYLYIYIITSGSCRPCGRHFMLLRSGGLSPSAVAGGPVKRRRGKYVKQSMYIYIHI